MTLTEIIKSIENLKDNEQEYVLQILNERIEISKTAKEAENDYIKGNIKTGTVEDFWNDIINFSN